MTGIINRGGRLAAVAAAALLTAGFLTPAPALADQIPEYRGVNAQHHFGGDSDDMVPWKIDIVRETVHTFDRAPFGTEISKIGDTWYHGLQNVVDRNRRNGITTILAPFSWEGGPLVGYTPSQTSFWTAFKGRLAQMAGQFKAQPDVWLEVWNEPYAWEASKPTDPDVWLSDMKQMVDAIRGTGATNTIVIPGGRMAADEKVLLARGHDLLAHDPQRNIVFDLHAYHEWTDGYYDPTTNQHVPGGRAGIEARIQRLLDADIDFIFGEFGAAGPAGYRNPAEFIEAVSNKGITSLAWIWTSADANHLINSDGSWNNTAQNFNWANQVHAYTTGPRAVVPEPASVAVAALAAGALMLGLLGRRQSVVA